MNEPWLTSSVEVVKRLINEVNQHIAIVDIYILGFSQGACLALEATARYARPYGGIISFIGGLIGDKIETGKYSGDFKGTRIFIGNSAKDPHVPLVRSEESKFVLERLGAEVTLKVYPNKPHTIISQEITDVRSLLFG
jgi:phospholipase/carboxylesterase